MKRQLAKIGYGGCEYRITYDEESCEYRVTERWYSAGWHTRTTGKYNRMTDALEDVYSRVANSERCEHWAAISAHR